MSRQKQLELASAPIVIANQDGAMLRLAAGDLARYLFLLTGQESPLVGKVTKGVAIELDQDSRLSDQGYRISVKVRGNDHHLVIAGASPVGVLYGVYAFLETLGVGFYNGGDCLPDLRGPISIPEDFELAGEPAFPVRGVMLHYNFLCGVTDWGLSDYRFFFDQLSRQRMNLLLMHWYDDEPGAAYEVDGEYLAGGRTPGSLSKPWGALAALRTSEFSFGVGRCYDEEIWSSPAGDDLPDRITEIKQTEAIFRAATGYAKQRGVRVAAGFEAPNGADPTDEQVKARFRARMTQFLARNPELTYFALWQHESGGCTGSKPPAAGPAAELLEARRPHFAHCGNEYRVWEAVRFGEFGRIAAEFLENHAPHLRLVLVGWGGDRWMRFADYCLGYDKLLPPGVIFTCHENIDASLGTNVSTPWGQLPPGRERWAMPWVEGDINDCWTRQPHVESLGRLAPDALAKGCQGLLNLQWRTRDVEEENGFIARFAWDPELDPEHFYMDLAWRTFGEEHQEEMAGILATLQRLGARWTGVHGTAECSAMHWTGWQPHFPFDLNSQAVAFLVPLAEEVARVLAEIPSGDEDPQGGAFHLRAEAAARDERDVGRLGVREMTAIAEQLRRLALEREESVLRHGLWQIHEEAYALRYNLVTEGMVGSGYRAIDTFLFALHHLVRVAGHEGKMAQLKEIRQRLRSLRETFVASERIGRLERLDYLINSIDFVMHFDAVATLLADGEYVPRQVAACAKASPEQAATLAAECYERLVNAGMAGAIEAQVGKLTTRCDWGVLATLCVKPMPRYWETIGELERYLVAAPPRELRARGMQTEVWLSWELQHDVAGLILYRRPAEGGEWVRVNSKPLQPKCRMFVDRPEDGAWTYAVAALDARDREGPRSHPVTVTVGAREAGSCILACKPASQLAAGEPYQQRVVVRSDREIESVTLVYRTERDGEWWGVPMHHRFRDSYQAILPGDEMGPGLLEFYVQAEDEDGVMAWWPATAAQTPPLPWTMTVTDVDDRG